jgi:hypothetical protein
MAPIVLQAPGHRLIAEWYRRDRPTSRRCPMSRFRRRLNRWRNYFSNGDYAGSHGGSSSGSGSSQARAATEGGIHADRMRDSLGPK